MTSWNNITVLGDDGETTITGDERIAALRQYQATGSIHQYFLAPTDAQQARLDSGEADEDTLPASDWGLAASEIDWSGLPQVGQGIPTE